MFQPPRRCPGPLGDVSPPIDARNELSASLPHLLLLLPQLKWKLLPDVGDFPMQETIPQTITTKDTVAQHWRSRGCHLPIGHVNSKVNSGRIRSY